MIVVAGLTPAWQHTLSFERLHLGAVNRATEVHWCAAGKMVNAGIALARLGGPSTVLAPFGGSTGDASVADLVASGVPVEAIRVAHPTRVCTTLVERGSGETTELVENAGPLTDEELRRFVAAYETTMAGAATAVLIGSLTVGAPITFYRELLGWTPCPAIVDASGPEMLAALAGRPLLVKPNRDELGRSLGRAMDSDAALHEAMAELRARGAVWVVVSQGARALWALGPKGLRRFRPPAVRVVNPIGSGDCLAAGLAWALREGLPVEEAIRFGMAAGCDNAMQLLPARLDLARVRRLMAEVAVES